MEFIKKIADIYIQIFRVVVILFIAATVIFGVFAIGTGAPFSVVLVVLLVAPLLIILSFGLGAIFILIYEHLKSIDDKLS
tara:strand:+ start:163 stop:402 length:240 start_codon:yes stop_codon:yes gene_type:complete